MPQWGRHRLTTERGRGTSLRRGLGQGFREGFLEEVAYSLRNESRKASDVLGQGRKFRDPQGQAGNVVEGIGSGLRMGRR